MLGKDFDGTGESLPRNLPAVTAEAQFLESRARDFIAKGLWHEALAVLNDVIRLAPRLTQTYSLRATAYYSLGDPEKAIADCHVLIEREPSSGSAWAQRAIGYERQMRYDEAILDYTEAIRLGAMNPKDNLVFCGNAFDTVPDNALALIGRARCYAALHDYSRAIDDLDKVVSICPCWSDGFKYRAVVYRSRRDYERAAADYTMAISVNGGDAHAYVSRAGAYFLLGRIENGIADCTKAIELAPSLPNAWMQRAHGFHIQGNYDRAINDYTVAMALDADDAAHGRTRATATLDDAPADVDFKAAVLAGRANAYSKSGDYEMALKDLEKLIDLHPYAAFGFARRALVHRRHRNFQRAQADCATALRLDANCAKALGVRGTVHAHLRQNRLAIRDFSRALDLQADDAWTLANRGLAYLRLKEYEQAVDDFTKAIRLSPQRADLFEQRGRALFRLGQWLSAIADFTRATEINPNLKRAIEYRGTAREAIGDYEGARDDRLAAEGLAASKEEG